MSILFFWTIRITLFFLILALVFALIRLVKGPSAPDRVVALDSLYTSGLMLMLVLGMFYGSRMYFEAALLIAMFGFVGSTAMSKFLLRGEVIE